MKKILASVMLMFTMVVSSIGMATASDLAPQSACFLGEDLALVDNIDQGTVDIYNSKGYQYTLDIQENYENTYGNWVTIYTSDGEVWSYVISGSFEQRNGILKYVMMFTWNDGGNWYQLDCFNDMR